MTRVAPGPGSTQEGRPEEERRSEQQGQLALEHQPPVVVLGEAPKRAAEGRRVVDEMPGAIDETLEVRDRGVAGEAPARKGQIGGRAAVAAAQLEDTCGPELLRAATGLPDERLELLPRGAALAQESVYVQHMELEDTMTITTPEGIDLQLALAGLGSRISAALIDVIIQGLLVVGVTVFFGSVGILGGWGLFAYTIIVFVVIFAYHILFEVLASGRTPGKRLNGLRVVRLG